jgi:serine/threonine-protein kinase
MPTETVAANPWKPSGFMLRENPMVVRCPESGAYNSSRRPVLLGFTTCGVCGYSFDTTRMGFYRIGAVLRSGLVDNVYEGQNLDDGSAVAIKVPVPEGNRLHEDSRWFIGLCEQLAYISHPLVVPLECVFSQSNLLGAASRIPAGTSVLSDLVFTKPDVEAAIALVMELAEVLHLVHERWSMVHGDLNPRTVLLRSPAGARERRMPSILAICLSKPERDENAVRIRSRESEVTPYMSPEQRADTFRRIDVRSDVYSLGAILHLLLFRRPPSLGGAASAIGEDFSLADDGGLAVVLQRIIARAMARDPADRYQCAGAVASDLVKLLGGGG